MNPYRIAVNAQTLFMDGLKEIVGRIPGVEVVAAHGNGYDLVHVLNRLEPNMVIFDIRPPTMDGLIAVQGMKRRAPQVKTLVLSTYRDIPNLLQAFKYGADGYLLKDDSPAELIKAVETIRNECTYISPFFSEEMPWIRAEEPAAGNEPRAGRPTLSPRRQKVLELIAEGKTTNEIAGLLGISIRTVEHHRESIKKKLKLSRTADLIRYALNNKEWL